MKSLPLAALALGSAVILAVPAVAETVSTAQQSTSATQTMSPGYGPMGRGMGMGGGMMGRRGMSRGGSCGGMGIMGGMTMMRYPDGALAFLKAELKIKDSQAGKWKAFAHAARTSAASTREMWQKQWRQGWRGTLPQRLERREHMMAFRLETMRTVSAALVPLYNSLDAGQKRTADTLFMSCGGMGHGMGMGMGGGMGWRWQGGANQ